MIDQYVGEFVLQHNNNEQCSILIVSIVIAITAVCIYYPLVKWFSFYVCQQFYTKAKCCYDAVIYLG